MQQHKTTTTTTTTITIQKYKPLFPCSSIAALSEHSPQLRWVWERSALTGQTFASAQKCWLQTTTKTGLSKASNKKKKN